MANKDALESGEPQKCDNPVCGKEIEDGEGQAEGDFIFCLECVETAALIAMRMRRETSYLVRFF